MALVNGGYLHYMEIKKFLRILLLWNGLSEFEIISQGCSLNDPFQKLFVKFWSVKKHSSGEWGLLALYGNEEILKNSSSLKLLVRFWNNFTEMFLGWLFLAHLSTTCSRGAFRITQCPSCVSASVRCQQFFKHQLLLNRFANLDQTWLECSLGGPL